MKKQFAYTVALTALFPALSLTGCSLFENQLKIDRDNNLEFQDVRDSLAPRDIPVEKSALKFGDVPEFADYSVDNPKGLRPMPLVTISVNESIPLKDVLYELAQQANYDVELDPRIKGAIIFSAKNRPFDQVMERIADMASLRYKFDDNVVRVELDTPYSETYKIDYLSMVRSTTSTVQNNATVSGGGSSGGSSSTGSTFSLSGKSEVDFWKELDANLKQILESNSPENALKTNKTPVVSAAPASVTPPAAPTTATPATTETGGTATPPAATAVPAPTAPTLDISAVEDTATDDSTTEDNQTTFTPTYSLNKQAGLVSVFANERVHKKIKDYLKQLQRSVGAQVLIEAKVFEVSLNDDFATGINWDAIQLPASEFSLAFGSNATGSPLPGLTPASTASFSLGYTGNDLTAVIEAVSRFGTVHALASPRLTVMNNQSAVLNVAQNQTYFELDIETTTNQNTVTTTVESEAKSVPEGVLVNVTPSINLDDGQVTMTVRPTISRIDGFEQDPAVAFAIANAGLSGAAAASLQSNVPNVSVQEFDSVIKLKSGDVVVMGGLLQDRATSEQNGVPVLSEAPLIGGLFRKQADGIKKTELVVFMRATIIDGGNETIHQTDRDLYKIYSQDRRPFPL
jgi:MSHA biogenesis protein MshL